VPVIHLIFIPSTQTLDDAYNPGMTAGQLQRSGHFSTTPRSICFDNLYELWYCPWRVPCQHAFAPIAQALLL
jgi:hypothetical protein